MADRNKFEEMLERLVNEDRAGAEELFHEIVVERSRDIYESLLEDDLEEMDHEDEDSDDEDSEDEMETEGFDLEEFEVEGDEDDMGMGGDPADDMMSDIEADMDDDDDEMSDDDDDEEMEDRIVDLEDALDDLKAEFEKMMADDDDGDDDDMDMGEPEDEDKEEESFEFEADMKANEGAGLSLDQAREYFFDKHDFADENIQGEYEKMASKMSPEDAETLKKELEEFYPDVAFEGYDNEPEEMDEVQQMREYVEKVAMPKGEDNKASSPVASTNDMGGDSGNLVQGGEEKGRAAPNAKDMNTKNVNYSGSNTATKMNAVSKTKGKGEDGGVNKKSGLGS